MSQSSGALCVEALGLALLGMVLKSKKSKNIDIQFG